MRRIAINTMNEIIGIHGFYVNLERLVPRKIKRRFGNNERGLYCLQKPIGFVDNRLCGARRGYIPFSGRDMTQSEQQQCSEKNKTARRLLGFNSSAQHDK